MGIYNNFPALTWIKLDGISISYIGNTYMVEDFKTNLKYIYWQPEIPTKLSATNISFESSPSKFLIAVNNLGECLTVPNKDIQVSFDGNSYGETMDRIYGLYEKTDEHTKKFVTVEQNIDGIKTTVGQWDETKGSIAENISKIEQNAKEIDLSVKEVKKTYKEDALRESVNKCMIDLNSSLGLFYSKILDYFKDDTITTTEKTEIQVQYTIINTKKDNLYLELDKVLANLQADNQTTHIANINNSKNALTQSILNLQSVINSAISDNVISTTDRTLVVNAFANVNLKTNDLKNVVDNAIILGMGGSISESISQINMKSNEINLSVQETDKFAKSQIQILSNEISSKVSAGDVSSIIRQSPNDIKFGFNGISDYVIINTTGLTVKRGSVACSSINTPSGTDPIITLFGQCSLDATLNYETGGFGQYMRMKWDRYNYLAVGQGEAVFYQKFGASVNNIALKVDMTNNSTTRLSGGFGEMRMASHGLYFQGELVSMSGHKHGAGDLTFDNTQSAYFGNVKTGTYPTRGTYIGGFIDTTGDVKATAFNTHKYSSSTTYRGHIETTATMSVTPNVEYIGESSVVNGVCEVFLPDAVIGVGTSYSIQITPIGDDPHIYVNKKNKNSFIVKGDDCDFDYIIKVKLPKIPNRLKNKEV